MCMIMSASRQEHSCEGLIQLYFIFRFTHTRTEREIEREREREREGILRFCQVHRFIFGRTNSTVNQNTFRTAITSKTTLVR